MTAHIHCHVPYPRLSEHLGYLVSKRLNPEIYLPAEALDRIIWEELAAQAQRRDRPGGLWR